MRGPYGLHTRSRWDQENLVRALLTRPKGYFHDIPFVKLTRFDRDVLLEMLEENKDVDFCGYVAQLLELRCRR